VTGTSPLTATPAVIRTGASRSSVPRTTIRVDPGVEGHGVGVGLLLELHLNTPLGHEGLGTAPVTVPDSLSLTGGMHFTFFNRVRFTAGAATPLTGPRPFDFAAFAQFNVLF